MMNEFVNIDNYKDGMFFDEVMSKHTTYKIGGPARIFTEAWTISHLQIILENAKNENLKVFIIGGGSNLLVSDDGFDGIVIQLKNSFQEIKLDESKNVYQCGAAVKTSNIVKEYLANKHKGAEFLAGIPGTIGGAVKMNAGRKDDWISSIIESVTILDTYGNVFERNVGEFEWGYRSSSIKDDEIILSVNLKYQVCLDISSIKEEVKNLTEERKSNQPLNKLSCGSVFKNPKDNSAGKLIEEAGFKGKSVGGAKVSDVHANFIINENNARANDVLSLIQQIQNAVYEKFDIKLIPEVKFLGFKEKCSLF